MLRGNLRQQLELDDAELFAALADGKKVALRCSSCHGGNHKQCNKDELHWIVLSHNVKCAMRYRRALSDDERV